MIFPVCDGDQWPFLSPPACPVGQCTATATYLSTVTVPAGTFHDCYEILYDVPAGYDDQTWTFCPCFDAVRVLTGDLTAELITVDRCPGGPDDQDEDGYLATECLATTPCGGDCNDSNAEINPGAAEGPFGDPSCSDQLDNDCDGFIDEADSDCTLVPDIKANGSDGPVTISPTDSLDITISLDPGTCTDNADWWVLASTPFQNPYDWVHFTIPPAWLPGMLVTYQGQIFPLAPFSVLNLPGLPVGNYTFFFGVDTDMNGILDIGQLFYDGVGVNVVP